MDLSEVELNQVVYHDKLGLGRVIKCSEEPSVMVSFVNGTRKKFNRSSEGQLRVPQDKDVRR